MSQCVTELEYCINILTELRNGKLHSVLKSHDIDAQDNIIAAVKCWTDNQASICVGNQSAETRRSRHINRDFHNVKDAILKGVCKFGYVRSENNKADLLTKNLGPTKFMIAKQMMNLSDN